MDAPSLPSVAHNYYAPGKQYNNYVKENETYCDGVRVVEVEQQELF